MNSKPKIAIIGAGALGAYYGALLVRAGFDVHFLVKSDADFIKKNGLRIDSKDGNFLLQNVNVYDDINEMPKCDWACVCLKTTQNGLVFDYLLKVLKPNGAVIHLQNGINFEEELSQKNPDWHQIGGLCFLCSNKIGPGHIHHLDYGYIKLGALESRSSKILSDVFTIFKEAKISVSQVSDLRLARWQKLIWNIPYNGLCVLFNCNTAELAKNEIAVIWVQEIMKEVQSAALGEGCIISNEFIDKMIQNTKEMVDYKPSMLIDFEKGRSLELEYIYETPISCANKNQIKMPETKALLNRLKSIKY